MASSSQDQSGSSAFRRVGSVSGPQGLQQGINQAALASQLEYNNPGRQSESVIRSRNLANRTLAGDYLNPLQNNTALAGLINNQAHNIQQQVQSRFGAAGRNVGGPGVQRQFADTLAQVSNPLIAQNYENERGRQFNTMFASSQFDPLMQFIQRQGLLSQANTQTNTDSSGQATNAGSITNNPSFLDMALGGLGALFSGISDGRDT